MTAMTNASRNTKFSVKRMTITAVFMALNIVLSSFGMPVPGGHLYLNDIVIVAASLILNPLEAFLAGGIGAFLGDLFFYPAPMFVSLTVHGIQAALISYISHKGEFSLKKDILAVSAGAVIMVAGYTIGRAYIYSTPQAAILKLPYQIAQALVGAAIGTLLVYKLKMRDRVSKF